MPPGLAWPIVRLLLAVAMLLLAAQAAANQDPQAHGVFWNALGCVSIALAMAGVPMILPSYRSLRMFSWLLLIAAFFQLYVRRDGLLSVPAPVGMLGAAGGGACRTNGERSAARGTQCRECFNPMTPAVIA
jgi:hypothetical protein